MAKKGYDKTRRAGLWAIGFAFDTAVDWVLQKGLVVLSPWVIGAVTAVWAALDDFPGAYLIAVTAFVFWATAAGVNSFDQLLIRRTPRSKLAIGDPQFMVYVDPKTNKPAAIQFGFHLSNQADFPIEYEIEEISSAIGGRINPAPKHDNLGAVLDPRSLVAHWDASIPIDSTMENRDLEGELKAVLRYGRKGRLSYEHEKHVALRVFMSREDTKLATSMRWSLK